ncbi:WXG100 family type VII secretion target [Muricomes intestini]|uniref:ESAT-6-like protein n=1 Tax=Muricomes intestini TaxID=1796634 RepID=A0A4R3K3K5_9FIRM|nr:WXG100 family type VII secretion target [Muricomes intestini]TCS77298.1 WXG100 family type VII secretion target [Muricomes intestini]
MALQMDFDDVVAQGQNITSHSQDVTDLQTWLNNVVNEQLPAMWQGSGYEGFSERVAEMAPSFEAMKQLIEDIGNGVVQNANQYREFDESAGNANRG